ncbi:MAG: lipid-A-disaccharide synthase [Bacteroidia bacterium]|nr:lipid-A-disaccharide synthase [Bacteroidia bacterium]MDW8416717.1 lipid-A-disaccharide synthase [Bacteroidia bacterium]
MEKKRLYWVVGELSGELHAVSVIKALRQLSPNIEMRGMGGELMANHGVQLITDWKAYAVVGFVEVLRNLSKFIRLYRRLQKDILDYAPDQLILVDYPGLNLRLARWAVRRGIKVTYFIPPQLWAWNPGRVRHLRHPLVQILCILPFEPAFYAQYGVKATYVGHPLLKQVEGVTALRWSRPYIALLPGSRIHEVKNMLPLMAKLPSVLPEWDFIVSKVKHLPVSIYEQLAPGLPLVEGQTQSLLAGATAAVVTSGTATLEAALIGTPSVIVYKGNYFSYLLAKQLVRVPFIGLPNLILGEPIFPELIQSAYTLPALEHALRTQIQNQQSIKAKLLTLRERLSPESAAEVAAQAILISM